MIGAIEVFMTTDHARLDDLLRASQRDDGTIERESYAAFRAGLLRHIAMEEKVLLPFARTKRGGKALMIASALRADHGQMAALLVPSPDRGVCDALRALLAEHNPLEEGCDGLYATCDALAATEGESAAVVAKLRDQPAVLVARHYDGPLLQPRRRAEQAAKAHAVTLAPAVAERVKRDHATIRAVLDEVERCSAAAREQHAGALDAFRRAVWDLHLAFGDHVAMEEAEIGPVLRGVGRGGEARAVAMILEHNEQRRVMLELVEDVEYDVIEVDVLVREAAALILAFKTDMMLEERSLAPLLAVQETRCP